MKDILGNIINVGDTVQTRQPSGGILSPASPVNGIVILSEENELLIKYRKAGCDFNAFI